MRDAHKILSVGRNATMQDIKVAYRRLALQLHPDTNGGDAAKSERFKQVNDAYTYLTDPKAKEQDMFDDFEQYATYSNRPNYTHSSNSHWNPFQSPFQNMKNAQKAKNKNKSNPFGDFEEWDSVSFVDFDTGEDIVFGFDRNGKAKTSRKQSAHGSKKKKGHRKEKRTQSSHDDDDPFAEFTTEEIEDILRNSTSTSPGWGSAESFSPSSSQVRGGNSPHRKRRSNNNNNNHHQSNSKGGKNRKKPHDENGGDQNRDQGTSGGNKKASRSRRRRRGGDDCTIC